MLFIGYDGVCVLSIALFSVDLGVGSLAGPVCNVVGFIGVFVTNTGFLFTGVAWTSVLTCPCSLASFTGKAFFPNLTDAGLGLIFITAVFAITGLAASFIVFFAVLVALT